MLAALAAMPKGGKPVPLAMQLRLGKAVAERIYREKGKGWGKAAVEGSADLDRVRALPVREPPTLEEQRQVAESMTALLALDRQGEPCRCRELRPNVREPCIRKLLPIQGWYLREAMGTGVLGFIRVGGGKEGIGILLPMVVPNTRVAALFIPPNLRPQFETDFEVWSQHFRTPNLAPSTGIKGSRVWDPRKPVLRVLAYSELSHAKSTAWFTAHRPDLIVANEAQAFKNRQAALTGRLGRHYVDLPETRSCFHSGSLTTKSLLDYGHMAFWALKAKSPAPLDIATLGAWAGALDPAKDGTPAPMGALIQLCEGPQETVRDAYRRRLRSTQGVIVSDGADLDVRLEMCSRPVQQPSAEIVSALQKIRATQSRPDGEEFVEITEVVSCLRQVASGFYYVWRYPRGEPRELIDRWFQLRQAWHRELRKKLEFRREGIDSPLLCKQAALRAEAGYEGDLPVWRSEHLRPWLDVQEQVQPEQGVVWVSDFLAEDAVAWAREEPGVVWYEWAAFGHRVAELGQLPHFGAGAEASSTILREDGSRSIVASVKAHGTGKNLQAFHRMLVANPPGDGGTWEQILGRAHRYGQEAPSVTCEVYQHTPEFRDSVDRAIEQARYTYETTGVSQKLLYADWAPPPAIQPGLNEVEVER
jgi:hypothetical protein